MHNRIYKYQLRLVERQVLPMPSGSKILSIQNQKENICLWAMVDTGAKIYNMEIAIIGTGNPFPKIKTDQILDHLDTVQLSGMVWHVFEIKQKP